MTTTYKDYQQIFRLSLGSSQPVFTESSPTYKASNTNLEEIPFEKKKILRTKTGCLNCRRRKKKCDERSGTCSGCERNYLECVYPHQKCGKSIMKKPSNYFMITSIKTNVEFTPRTNPMSISAILN